MSLGSSRGRYDVSVAYVASVSARVRRLQTLATQANVSGENGSEPEIINERNLRKDN